MKTLTKLDLAKNIEEETGLCKEYSKDAVNTIVDILKAAIYDKKIVYIPKLKKI